MSDGFLNWNYLLLEKESKNRREMVKVNSGLLSDYFQFLSFALLARKYA